VVLPKSETDMFAISSTCKANDWRVDLLTLFLCLGTIVSYLPQHARIIAKKSSEGFSPWFLLLGSTAALSNILNLVIKQWTTIKCCSEVGPGACLGLVGGIILCGIVWVCFTLILVLYMIYYPPHLKYIIAEISPVPGASPAHIQTNVRTDEWQISVLLAWAVFFHMAFTTFVTFLLLITGTPHQRDIWATFLGTFAATSTVIQYAPQLERTYRAKLVGALSIPTMCIQTPGSVLMVTSVALRPGTNWTSWITFAMSGILQGALLAMCLVWKMRQSKLGLDDFGNALDDDSSHTAEDVASRSVREAQEGSSIPITDGPPAGETLHDAVEEAVDEDVRSLQGGVDERTPLIRSTTKNGEVERRQGLFGWLRK